MLFEVLTTTSMLSVIGGAYYFDNKTSNDHDKIKKIADELGLKAKDESIRIYRKRKHEGYTEYIYKIPLGLSFKQFEKHKDVFVDGLNNKSRPNINLKRIKEIDWNDDIFKQLKEIFLHRERLDKQIEFEYDGMLKIRVYNKGLETLYEYDEKAIEQLRGWEVLIGYTFKELIKHDFEKRPHMIVAGATGFGKSEFVKLLIATLIHRKPNDVRLHLIDLKGGAELGPFRHLKQTKHFSRKLPHAHETLLEIQKEMDHKLDWLFENGLKDVKRAGQTERDFIIIDEAGELDDESKGVVVDIARRGRVAGYRVIYTTQYPTNETLPSQVRANIGARVCFRLETNAQSRAVLDESGAEELPEVEGRAIFRRVKNFIVQTPYIEEKQIDDIIQPYINIRAKEGLDASGQTQKSTKTGSDTLKLEEVGLSN